MFFTSPVVSNFLINPRSALRVTVTFGHFSLNIFIASQYDNISQGKFVFPWLALLIKITRWAVNKNEYLNYFDIDKETCMLRFKLI